MAKKLVAMLLAGAMIMSFSTVAFAEEGAEVEASAVTTVGPDDAVGKFELWSFVDVHNEFYANMVNEWNELNPDKTVQITFSTYPYDDMHNKFMMSLQAGSGAPDICDVEISKFPAYIGEDCPLYDMTEAMAPYADTMVPARMDIYKSISGAQVGVPTHVGAAFMYWNAEIFEKYGLDYKSVVTWDDYTELGRKLKEASNGEVMLTSVDTASVEWIWASMVQYGDDWTGGHGGQVNVQLESVEKMLTMQQEWLNEGIAMISPDGHVDLEAGYANVAAGNIASFPKAAWYMSRFINYMPEMEGKYDITPLPVWEEGQIRSVAFGGTGTVISNQCENQELAAEWLCWAKCSPQGAEHIWSDLGFDVCNTAVWGDEEFAYKEDNVYNTFFRVKPYEILNQMKDEIGMIYVTSQSLTLNEYFTTTALNNIFEDGWVVADALQDAQDYIAFELGY